MKNRSQEAREKLKKKLESKKAEKSSEKPQNSITVPPASSSSSSSRAAVKEKSFIELVNEARTFEQVKDLEKRYLVGDFAQDPDLLAVLLTRYKALGKVEANFEKLVALVVKALSLHQPLLRHLLQKDKFAHIIKYWEENNLLETFAWNSALLSDLGWACFKCKQPQAESYLLKAIDIYDRREKILPGMHSDKEKSLRILMHIRLSNFYLENDRPQEAIKQAEIFLSLANSQTPLSELERGYTLTTQACIKLGQTEQAWYYLNKITDRNPLYFKLIVQLAKIYYQEGKIDKTIELISAMISKPAATSSEEVLGFLTLIIQENPATKKLLMKHSAKVKTATEASFFAHIYIKANFENLELLDEARRLLETVTLPTIFDQIMMLYIKVRKITSQQQALNKQITKEIDDLAQKSLLPSNLESIRILTGIYIMSKLWPKLIEYAERVNEEVGMIPSLLEAQSMAYKALGKLDKVLEVDKSIYSMKDYQPKRNILFDILLAHYALEDYQQVFDTATEMIRKGKVEKNIRGFDVISFLEGAYEQTKNHGKIIELCQLYLQTNPLYHRNCLLLLFQVYFNIGKYNKAEKYLQIILQNEPDNITALEQLVSIALVNGDKDLTIESGIKLVKLKPTYFADNDDLKTILKDHGIWDKIAPYAKFEAESPASGSDVEEAENELPAVSVLQEQSSSVSSSTQPSEIPAPSMASSTKADGVTSLQASSESTFQPAKPALPKVEEQQKPGQWVKKVAPKVVRRDSLTQASSSAVVSILKRSPSKESLRDKDKQTILEYMKQAFKKEGDALAKKLLDILPKLGLGPSYQKELRKVTREPKKELKEESKEQSSIPKPNDPDVYAIDGGKLYVKLDYHKVKEQAEEWHRGKSDSIMQEIVATLEKARNARDYGQSDQIFKRNNS